MGEFALLFFFHFSCKYNECPPEEETDLEYVLLSLLHLNNVVSPLPSKVAVQNNIVDVGLVLNAWGSQLVICMNDVIFEDSIHCFRKALWLEELISDRCRK